MAQCSSCHFQNMPGVTQCGRCGASLMLATAVIDVHPPRATKWARFWRKSIGGRLLRSSNDAWTTVGRRIKIEPDAPLPPPPALLRLVVPGWSQIYLGRVNLGRWMMAGYFIVLILAVLFFGTYVGSMLLGLLLTVHAISLYDVAYHSTSLEGGRISRFLTGAALLLLIVYYPCYLAVNQFASPMQMMLDRPPFARGDVLLTSKVVDGWRAPRPGDIAIYDIPQGLNEPNAGHVVYVVRGERIDRILAGPGQSIVWQNGELTVDGQPSPMKPLGKENLQISLNLTVPPGHFLIFPSTEQLMARGALVSVSEERWKFWSIVPARNIHAKVYWQHWPWNRAGFLR